jgi:hypothetical protein
VINRKDFRIQPGRKGSVQEIGVSRIDVVACWHLHKPGLVTPETSPLGGVLVGWDLKTGESIPVELPNKSGINLDERRIYQIPVLFSEQVGLSWHC